MAFENALRLSTGQVVDVDAAIEASQGERLAIWRYDCGVQWHPFRRNTNCSLQGALHAADDAAGSPDFSESHLAASNQPASIRSNSYALHAAIVAG
jgi:hypothetical protein